MLELCNIQKDYPSPDGAVHALRGVTINFRKSEFVSILGPSGCGKTTLLNIIGGLDHYTAGDLRIEGKSTKEYGSRDWDTYRNHSVGFVFQSYNLIPHQTVLANVELSLTLAGIPAAERRARAKAALEKVGLADQINKLPRQLSGGQMQRVAIARSLVNDPEILLADEPTGALDSVTSTQVMEILKEISKERLVIMVTHNPELADIYSTRIIRLRDGEVTDDTNPYDGKAETASEEKTAETLPAKRSKGKKKHSSMSFRTALSLSFRNLMTKKARTLMISFAGSIGIIGIALILSVSTGVQALIDSLERGTMSSYPLTIQGTSIDMGAMLGDMMENGTPNENKQDGYIYSHDVVSGMIGGMSAGIAKNDLAALKKYLESGKTNILSYINDIKYSYMTGINAYTPILGEDGKTTYRKNMKDYYDLMEILGMGSVSGSSYGTMDSLMGAMSSSTSVWQEMIGTDEFIREQYELLAGDFPKETYDVVLYVNEQNEISDYVLYMIGFLDVDDLKAYAEALEKHNVDPENNPKPEKLPSVSYTFDELLGKTFRVLTDADHYKLDGGKAKELNELELNALLDTAPTIRITGILKPSENAVAGTTVGGIGYQSEMIADLIARVDANEVVKAQKANPDKDIFTGAFFRSFTLDDYDMILQMVKEDPTLQAYLPMMQNMPKEQVIAMANQMMSANGTSLEKNYMTLGVVDVENPSAISIYPKDFEAKDAINAILEEFSAKESKLTYTDTIAIMLESVTTIVNAISYVLVAFVAISLVVSSIMIGVITYISVLERTKEIGILRALGASKRDISRVFNAETMVIGFSAGALGILISLVFIAIINVILFALTELAALKAVLGVPAALILIGISVVLTLIAGLFPAKVAANKDPVVALRTE